MLSVYDSNRELDTARGVGPTEPDFHGGPIETSIESMMRYCVCALVLNRLYDISCDASVADSLRDGLRLRWNLRQPNRRRLKMAPGTKRRILHGVAFLLVAATAALGSFAFVLIREGAYPPEGTGSLGHVGLTIAGIIAAFLTVVSGLFALLCVSRARGINNKTSSSLLDDDQK